MLNQLDCSRYFRSVLVRIVADTRLLIITAYWYQENGNYVLCGNASGSTKCPYGYVCLKDRGMK